jgi:hypothetical protein
MRVVGGASWTTHERVEREARRGLDQVFRLAALGGVLQGDFESELFELGDEIACSPLRVLAGAEVVVAEIVEQLAGAEQVPDELDQGVGDGDGSFVGAAAARDLTVLGPEVASFRACCGSRGLDQRSPKPRIAVGGADAASLACRFVVARAEADPGGQIAPGSGSGTCRRRSRR